MNQSPDDRSSGRRRILKAGLYCAFALSFLFMSWQLWGFFSRRISAPEREESQDTWGQAVNNSQKSTNDVLTELSGRNVAGILPVRAEPPVKPPDGASPLFAVGRKSQRKGWVDLQWSYRCNGKFEDVQNHYRKSLTEKGFRYVDTAARAADRRTMVFRKKDVLARIILRTSIKKEKIVNSIVFVLFRPMQKDDFVEDKAGAKSEG